MADKKITHQDRRITVYQIDTSNSSTDQKDLRSQEFSDQSLEVKMNSFPELEEEEKDKSKSLKIYNSKRAEMMMIEQKDAAKINSQQKAPYLRTKSSRSG